MNPRPASSGKNTATEAQDAAHQKLSTSAKRLSRSLMRWRKASTLNLVQTFRQFSPNSRGNYHDKAELTVDAVNETFPLIVELAGQLETPRYEAVEIASAANDKAALESAAELEKLLKSHGSDKAHPHNYHLLYGAILKDRESINGVLEIGMGTDNKDVISNMGAAGRPGASLRAFRDHLPNANIFGADIDKRILFAEDRIETFWCDQTSQRAFNDLAAKIPDGLDLIIDDGLHSPHANLRTLAFGLKKVRVGGLMVVEDIHREALPVWQAVATLFAKNPRFEVTIYRAAMALVFAVRKVA